MSVRIRCFSVFLPFGFLWCLPALLSAAESPVFVLPTANRALFEPGGEDRFFVGTEGKPWQSGTFGCVRSSGNQFHEGLDIRCLERDAKGEPADPVGAVADGTVAYINRQPWLSNYGKYLVVHHQVDGLDVYSLYAHLSRIQDALKQGMFVRQGQTLGIMGRTANTKQRITRARAHVHLELCLQLNPRYATWLKRHKPRARNDHGNWNGLNLMGFDPRAVFLAERDQGKFRLRDFLWSQPELCRVFVRSTDFSFLNRYPALVIPNPRAAKEGIVGYEIHLSFNGLPLRLIPRSATEIPGQTEVRLLAVNVTEAEKNPACHLVTKRTGEWELTAAGRERVELLTY